MEKLEVISVIVELDLVRRSKIKNVFKKAIDVKISFEGKKLRYEISTEEANKIDKILDPWWLSNSREFAVKISDDKGVLYQGGFYTTVADFLPSSYSIFNDILGEAIKRTFMSMSKRKKLTSNY